MVRRMVAVVLCWTVSTASAVTVSHWTQKGEADFKTGKFHNVVATNLGDLKLSRAVRTLMEQDPKIGAVYSLAQAGDGTVYAGTGPGGIVLQVAGDAVSTVAEIGDGVNVTSLLVDGQNRLLIGTSGTKGQVLRVDKPGQKPKEIFSADGVQYVWAMVRTADDHLYLATGPNGQLFDVAPDASQRVLVKTEEDNLTCLIGDGKQTLYFGTNPNGLVYKADRRTGESFVLLDAAETEIGALALDGKGNLYAGTAEASEEPAGTDVEAGGEKDKAGRPEGGGGGAPIEAGPAAPAPAPPAAPPTDQPDPLPKAASRTVFLVDGEDPGDKPAPPAPAPPQKPGPPKPPAATPGKAGPNPPPPTQQGINTTGTGAAPSAGNAVYKIDPDGLVGEVFRGPVLVLSMVEQNGSLLVGTGSDGWVYQLNFDGQETVAVARVQAKQVTALLPLVSGRVMLGLANVGGLAEMGGGFAESGTYQSQVFDATQSSRLGKLRLHGSLPAKTTLTVSTRSGNVKEPAAGTWTGWTKEQPASQFVATTSPAARFFQYRITFGTGDAALTPVIDDVDLAYQMPNLPPVVKSVKVTPGTHGAADADTPAPAVAPVILPGRIRTISWDASDPNNDPLLFDVYYRRGKESPWVLLKDKLKDPFYEWDTRTVADGRYQVKVTASDAAVNPAGQGKTASRVSESVLVDNTPPVINDVKAATAGGGTAVDVKATDATDIVAAVDYAVDSSQDWQAAGSSDSMLDSPEAAVHFTVAKLAPGRHEIAIRVTDSRGNAAYQTVVVGTPAAEKP